MAILVAYLNASCLHLTPDFTTVGSFSSLLRLGVNRRSVLSLWLLVRSSKAELCSGHASLELLPVFQLVFWDDELLLIRLVNRDLGRVVITQAEVRFAKFERGLTDFWLVVFRCGVERVLLPGMLVWVLDMCCADTL